MVLVIFRLMAAAVVARRVITPKKQQGFNIFINNGHKRDGSSRIQANSKKYSEAASNCQAYGLKHPGFT